MLAADFSYDGHLLSDFGYMICSFESEDLDEVSAGAVLTFNKVARHSGRKYDLVGTTFDECIEVTFDICKDICKDGNTITDSDDLIMTSTEFRALMLWLNRQEFLETYFVYDDNNTDDREICYYDASFNVSKISANGVIYGARLTMETNRPYGYGKRHIGEAISLSHAGGACKFTIDYEANDVGFVYPTMEIEISEDGDFSMVITLGDDTLSETEILNCVEGEVINIDGDTRIISTSESGHNIANDFNFDYPVIGRTYDNCENIVTTTALCDITYEYHNIIKDTPD